MIPPHLEHALRTTLVFTTIWGALFAYTWTVVRLAVERTPTRSTRFVWTIGCALFCIHVFGAWEVFYKWSLSTALDEIELQTFAYTGVRTSVGLWFNFAYLLLWMVDCAWWWKVGDESYRRRNRALFLLQHAYMIFLTYYGAFFFVHNWPRWIGLGMCIVAAGAVLLAAFRMRRQVQRPSPT